MNKDTPQSNTDWREEFEQRFGKVVDVTGFYDEYSKEIIKLSKEKRAIRDFISQLLEAEKRRWREERMQIENAINEVLLEMEVESDFINRTSNYNRKIEYIRIGEWQEKLLKALIKP